MNSGKLQEHFLATYCTLRVGLAALALAFPLILMGLGAWYGLSLQRSMSAYYYAFAPQASEPFPLRVYFVGILFAIGCFLSLYRGYSNTENWFLNIAGISALLVAIFPMEMPADCKNCGANTLVGVHYVAASLLFGCVAFVAFTCSEETLVELPEESKKRRTYRALYDMTATLMIALPLFSVALAYFFGVRDWRTFVAEFAGIYAFAAYWIIKSVELCFDKDTKMVEEMAMKGRMPTYDGPVARTDSQKVSGRLWLGRLLD